jgi:glycosyltransferase involved in cell wall biosynthesis
VLHVLPYDLARGAQRYARDLVDELDSVDERHLILTLFAAEPAQLRPDIRLDVPQGPMRRLGLDPRAVWGLRREIKRHQPAVVVAHGGEPAKYSAMALPRGPRLIYYRIGTVSSKASRPPGRILHRFYSRRADVLATVSNDVADEARRTVGGDTSVVVIPNGRDPEVFSPLPEPHRGPARLIFVGFLDEGKRPGWFIDAVAALRKQGVEFEAVLVGGGPLEETIRPAAQSAGVTMLGSRDDVPQLMAGSDVFVFPSLPRGEGMPGVLIEAGLSGLATVSTRVAGARDVVEDGVSGMLVDVDDKEAFIAAIGRLASDEELRRSMGSKARQRCVREFTMDASAQRWRTLLARVRDRLPVEDDR